MPAPFKQIQADQFAELVDRFPFKRKINAIHMHHTWRPDHGQYDRRDGHRTILGMYLHHTQVRKWHDIAQHVTIAPDGTIWLGRNWNAPPASASGHNGNAEAGPFMFEIIGDFDRGRDRLEGAQRKTVIEVIARMQKRWRLAPETLSFHNAMSGKTCPGSSVAYEEILGEVKKRHAELAQPQPQPGVGASRNAPFGVEYQDDGSDELGAMLEAAGANAAVAIDPADAEPCGEDAARAFPLPGMDSGTRAASGSALPPEKLRFLRPHLVNLGYGKFSGDGDLKTDQGDVDAMFGQHLQQALADARARGERLRIVFFAHGGLIKESAGLDIASKHVKWWIDNRVYPIYFIWETGLYETIGNLLRNSQQGARNFFSDRISDPIIEEAARRLNGPLIWGGMKRAAERSSATPQDRDGEGGAHYVARKLKEFCDRHGNDVELHAVGHSAGSIFHAHFLRAAHALKVPAFKSVHFLAPAIRVDTFMHCLSDLLGSANWIGSLGIFTMYKDFERDDHCAQIYRKSLLYLIHYSLEPEREAAILGLEQCLRQDAALSAMFGLDGGRPAACEVIFSKTAIDKGRSASMSTTHGGFDDDPPTMNSVARRILGKADADPVVEYSPARAGARSLDRWSGEVDWPQEWEENRPPPAERAAAMAATPAAVYSRGGTGRRRALCIGINDYADMPLDGCVADAEDWEKAFRGLGFDTTLLRDAQATRGAIIGTLNELIAGAARGDVIAFQFAGHGTQVPDLDGDEEERDYDEAIIPHDYENGGFLIDDDVRDIFARIPDGVNVSCFFDCCHSGTNTRFGVGAPLGQRLAERGLKRRFMPATEKMKEAHRQFRARLPAARAALPGGREHMKNIAFAACMSTESAWESAGRGDYTVKAISLLQAAAGNMTNEQFNQRLIGEFGTDARQRPQLDCASAARSLPLLQPLTMDASLRDTWRTDPLDGGPAAGGQALSKADLIRGLHAAIRQLQAY